MRLLGILNKAYKVKFNYDFDPKSIKKGPIILLSSHASRLEFIYMLYGFKRNDVNMVCGYQNILKKGIYHFKPLFGTYTRRSHTIGGGNKGANEW